MWRPGLLLPKLAASRSGLVERTPPVLLLLCTEMLSGSDRPPSLVVPLIDRPDGLVARVVLVLQSRPGLVDLVPRPAPCTEKSRPALGERVRAAVDTFLVGLTLLPRVGLVDVRPDLPTEEFHGDETDDVVSRSRNLDGLVLLTPTLSVAELPPKDRPAALSGVFDRQPVLAADAELGLPVRPVLVKRVEIGDVDRAGPELLDTLLVHRLLGLVLRTPEAKLLPPAELPPPSPAAKRELPSPVEVLLSVLRGTPLASPLAL